MPVTIIQGSEVKRPQTTPLTSSVLDHATVIQNADEFGLRNDAGLWPSYNCLDTLVPTSICPDPVGVKTFGFATWQPSFTFALHGGVQCKAVGLDQVDQKAEISRVFELNEGKGIEQALLLNRFVATGSGDEDILGQPAVWDAPDDLTPVAAVPLTVALALLEGYAARVYAGVPTIHMPRAAASLLAERIIWKNGKAFTLAGSKVAIGGGYDDEAMLASGVWDLYATGEVYVERSAEVLVQSIVLPGDGSGIGSGENGFADNDVLGLAERAFRVAVDCFVAKASGTVWA